MKFKLLFLIFLIVISIISVNAQKGPYLRFSLGPGVLNEYKALNNNGLTHVTKNHAIGWGFNDKYTIFFSEFGSASSFDVSEKYQYINTDVYGIGVGYRLPFNINFCLSGGYATLHFSDSWKTQGDHIENGYGLAFALDKKWLIGKHFTIGAGPHFSFYNYENYTLTNVSINILLTAYLIKQK